MDLASKRSMGKHLNDFTSLTTASAVVRSSREYILLYHSIELVNIYVCRVGLHTVGGVYPL